MLRKVAIFTRSSNKITIDCRSYLSLLAHSLGIPYAFIFGISYSLVFGISYLFVFKSDDSFFSKIRWYHYCSHSINVCNQIVKANLIEKIKSNLITIDDKQ